MLNNTRSKSLLLGSSRALKSSCCVGGPLLLQVMDLPQGQRITPRRRECESLTCGAEWQTATRCFLSCPILQGSSQAQGEQRSSGGQKYNGVSLSLCFCLWFGFQSSLHKDGAPCNMGYNEPCHPRCAGRFCTRVVKATRTFAFLSLALEFDRLRNSCTGAVPGQDY